MNKILTIAILLFGMSQFLNAQATNTTAKPAKKTTKVVVKPSTTTTAQPAAVGPNFTFKTELIDIGKVKRGEKKKFKFEFTNTGTEVMDFDIVSGCDCTTTEWPRNKVKIGEKGIIDVVFDSTEKEKSETVDIDIYLNNLDPKSKRPYFKRIKYKFELVD